VVMVVGEIKEMNRDSFGYKTHAVRVLPFCVCGSAGITKNMVLTIQRRAMLEKLGATLPNHIKQISVIYNGWSRVPIF